MYIYIIVYILVKYNRNGERNGPRRTDGRTKTDERTDRRTYRRTDGRTDGQTEIRTHGRMNGRTDGHTGARTDERTDKRTYGPYLDNGIFLFLPSSSAASASWRRLLFYHAATCFRACIVKTGLLQCVAVWTSVYDNRSVAVSSQCCRPSRRWSWSSRPRDRTNEEAPFVANQIPYRFQVMSDDARRCDWSVLAKHS